LEKEDSPSMLVPNSTIDRIISEVTETIYKALKEYIP
jgi:hypothetical protein